jgi:hypothetical protein
MPLIIFTIFLVVFGMAIAVAKGKETITKKWEPIADYTLAMIGVFVGVTLAIYLTDMSKEYSERKKTVQLLTIVAEDLKRYKRDINRFPTIFGAFKEKYDSENHNIAEFLNENPRRFPELLYLLFNSEYALSKLHPETIRQLRATRANLLKMHEALHHNDFEDKQLQSNVKLIDLETKVAIKLVCLEIEYQKGTVAYETMTKQQNEIMMERIQSRFRKTK